jgi:hypothetical protein
LLCGLMIVLSSLPESAKAGQSYSPPRYTPPPPPQRYTPPPPPPQRFTPPPPQNRGPAVPPAARSPYPQMPQSRNPNPALNPARIQPNGPQGTARMTPRMPAGVPPKLGSAPVAPRSLPPSIKPSSPVVAMKGFTGQVTMTGKPIVHLKGTNYQVPPHGVSASFKARLRSGTAPTSRWAAESRREVSGALKNLTLKTPTAPNQNLTVLGRFRAYEFNAASYGARRFSIPTNVWQKMSDHERWEANRKFLDRTIARGHQIRLATPAHQARPGSYYARELEYLTGKGYKISADGRMLTKE